MVKYGVMPEQAKLFSKSVNREARRRYPALAKQIGERGLGAWISRAALHLGFGYTFSDDQTLYPETGPAFGRIIQRSWEDGVREIHSSIADHQTEHQWLCLPDRNLWVDATKAASGTSVDSDDYLPVFLSYMSPRVATVHTHPDQVVAGIVGDSPWNYSDNYLLEAAQPSSNDLIRCAQMRARSNDDAQLTDHIISHHGLTTYSIHRRGGFTTASRPQYRIETMDTNPATTIHGALGRLSAAYANFDDVPAFSMLFAEL